MIIFAMLAGIILLTGIIVYNSLISKKNQVDNAFSTIDVMLKKRFDLLPNLVEIVKQYMQHESSVLNTITSLRSTSYSAGMGTGQKVALDADISKGVRSVMINAENYPELKADASFINLQRTWTESEEQIAAARRTFNAAVTGYNNAIMMFPGSLVANMMNYEPYAVISIPGEERRNINARDLFASNNA